MFALVVLAACGDNAVPDPSAECPRDGLPHACGKDLRDADGRVWIQRGVNFAGAHKYAPYTDDFGAADYQQLHAWGFRTTRFLIPWAAVEPAPGQYDDAYLDFVAMHAQMAHDAGLVMVLDMHQDVYGEGFGFDGAPAWTCDAARYAAFVPNSNWILDYNDANVAACFDHLWTDGDLQADFAAMWAHVAQRLAKEPAIVGFDPMNEPFWGTFGVGDFEGSVLEPFYLRVIDAVRGQAPWIAYTEPASSRNLGFASHLQPFGRADIVYAPHLYDPSAELNGTFDTTHRDSLLRTATELRGEADAIGAPLWIGEYGGIADSTYIGAYMDAAYDGAAADLAGSMYWSMDKDDGGYSILDSAGAPKQALIDAIARPYPSRIAGQLTAWSYDDATRRLDVSWDPDPAVTAPTVIVLPDMNVDLSCGDCVVEMGDGEASITGATSISVTPR